MFTRGDMALRLSRLCSKRHGRRRFRFPGGHTVRREEASHPLTLTYCSENTILTHTYPHHMPL